MFKLPDGKVLITAEDIQNNCRKLANIIKENIIEDIDRIVMLNRGGIIPGGYLSYYLDNRNTSIIDITLYENNHSPRETDEYTINELGNQLKKFNNEKILLVDDLIDTGTTINAVFEAIIKYSLNIDVYVAVIYNEKNSKYQFDDVFYAEEKPEGWLVFPWDI